jgi:predicted nucleic-acid-binding Zn-ribbon protein
VEREPSIAHRLLGDSAIESVEAGTFESWVCASCGYTEWYAKGVEAIRALATVMDTGVRRVVAEAPGGPFW